MNTACGACRQGGQRTAWNYLTVQLNRTSADERGDPDLFGLFWGGQSGQVRPLCPAGVCCSGAMLAGSMQGTHARCAERAQGRVQAIPGDQPPQRIAREWLQHGQAADTPRSCWTPVPAPDGPWLAQGRYIQNSSYAFDFRDTSSRFKGRVVKSSRRADFGEDSDYEGGALLPLCLEHSRGCHEQCSSTARLLRMNSASWAASSSSQGWGRCP